MTNKHIGDSLCGPCRHIISSDDDQPIVMDMYVGFDDSERLIVCVDLHDYDEPEYNCSTAAIVTPHDAREMARRNHVKVTNLPTFIADCMAEWDNVINPTFTHVRDCFKETTDLLLDQGCRLKIVRTLGKDSRPCF